MNEAVEKNLIGIQFYQSPVPLIIGNLPFGDSFQSSINDYEYLNVYKLIGSNLSGTLFYSKFFNNYIILDNAQSKIENMFPAFNIGNKSYSINPFINDVNGVCSWISFNKNDASKIHFNFSSSKYEYSLGEDCPYYDGLSFQINKVNYFNGAFERNIGLGRQINVANIEDISLFNLSNDYYVGSKYSLTLENGLNSELIGINLTFSNTLSGNINGNLLSDVYIRSNYVKDLDYEEDNEIPNILGVYIKDNSQISIGSWVLGNENDKEFGYFIGVNNILSPFFRNTVNLPNVSNVFEINRKTELSTYDMERAHVVLTEYTDDFVVLLGMTYNLDTPKYLWYLKSTYNDYEEPFKMNRLFITDSFSPSLLTLKKFWYAEVPELSSITYAITDIKLFQSSMEINSFDIQSLTFKYINLDDEEDVNEDVELQIIGMTRKNASYNLFGLPINVDDYIDKNSIAFKNYNTFIGYWDAPVTNILEENNE